MHIWHHIVHKALFRGLLEEDDEFEEFPAEEWSGGDKEPEIFWEEKWDDDNIEDDFSNQLKAVLEKN